MATVSGNTLTCMQFQVTGIIDGGTTIFVDPNRQSFNQDFTLFIGRG
jgi:hypothetical protein